MGKIKYLKISQEEIGKILNSIRLISKSLEEPRIVINQFNLLTPNKRIDILSEWKKRETILKGTVEARNEDMYLTCIMVELNIIASMYNIDPATVCMCIKPPCKSNEKVFVS